MTRQHSNGDHRRSSPFDSYKDRNYHHKKSQGSDNDEVRTRDRDLDRTKDRDWHHRGYKDKNVRTYRGRFKIGDRSHSRNYERGRNHTYAGDRENHHRHRLRSRSNDRSDKQARSQSKSPSRTRSKRRSGFDMAPLGAAAVHGVAEEIPGVSGISQAIPGMLQNLLSSEMTQASQLSYFPLFPVQTMSQQATRHARRVYVGGLPPLANEQTIAAFFSHVMMAIGGNSAGPGDAVVNVYINHEKKFAFVEMRTVEEASNAMALDGILFEDVALRVRRPTDYNPSLAASLGPSQPSSHLNLAAAGLTPGMTSEADGADRIFVGGLPYYFTETQIKELLESFGSLRGFDLVKDRDTGNSKGYGFCIYKDPAVTDIACAALNGLKLGDKTLTVRRATMSGQVKSEQEYILAQAQQHIAIQKMALEAGGVGLSSSGTEAAQSPTKVLCLSEAITPEELMDDGEYEEILQDMKEECQKFGDLINVIIPRPGFNEEELQGLGKVFLEYSDASGCANARAALSGRKFGGKAVIAIFYPEDRYYDGDYSA